MQTTAQAEHIELMDRITAATTVDEMTAARSVITMTETGRGWADDQAPGHYYNGHLLVTIAADNSRAYTDMFGIPHPARLLWEQAIEAETVRERGRPAIGRPIQVRLPQKTISTLDRWAAQEGISRSEAVRLLINMGIVAAHRADNRAQAAETGFPAGTVRVV